MLDGLLEDHEERPANRSSQHEKKVSVETRNQSELFREGR